MCENENYVLNIALFFLKVKKVFVKKIAIF